MPRINRATELLARAAGLLHHGREAQLQRGVEEAGTWAGLSDRGSGASSVRGCGAARVHAWRGGRRTDQERTSHAGRDRHPAAGRQRRARAAHELLDDRGVGVRRAPAPAARLFPGVPLRPPSPHQDPARDPELASPKPATLGAYLRHVSGLRTGASASGPRSATGARGLTSRSSLPGSGGRSCARRACCSAFICCSCSSRSPQEAPPCSTFGSGRSCSASRFCASIFSPSTPAGRWWRTCWRTRGRR